MADRSELLAEAERLHEVAEQTGLKEDHDAWREAELRLLQADENR